MNKEEAHRILLQELNVFRMKAHGELSRLVGSPIHLDRKAPSGTVYQVEIEVFWDDPRRSQGDVRVIASVDEGGLPSSFRPLTKDFIKSPPGGFVGE